VRRARVPRTRNVELVEWQTWYECGRCGATWCHVEVGPVGDWPEGLGRAGKVWCMDCGGRMTKADANGEGTDAGVKLSEWL
jgi:DNA-directed RNA polymerase subunit RPC12/RpoP